MFKFVPLCENPEFIPNRNAFYIIDTSTDKNLGIIVEEHGMVYVLSADNPGFSESMKFASREEAARYLQQTRS